MRKKQAQNKKKAADLAGKSEIGLNRADVAAGIRLLAAGCCRKCREYLAPVADEVDAGKAIRAPKATRAGGVSIAVMDATAADVGDVLGITGRRVQQMAKEGIIPKAAHGKYRIGDAVQAYFRHETENKSESAEDLKKEKMRKEILWLDQKITEYDEKMLRSYQGEVVNMIIDVLRPLKEALKTAKLNERQTDLVNNAFVRISEKLEVDE